MALFLNVNSTLISQVLSDRRDFSLEQAYALTSYFNFNLLESRYFMQLVHHARAGSVELKKFHLNEMEQIRKASAQIKNRVAVDVELTDSDKSFMVSTWKPSAIFVLTGKPGGIRLEEFKQHLQIDEANLKEILNRLVEIGLVELESGKYKTGFKSLHLPKKSDFLLRHLSNWRLKSIQQSEDIHDENVIYTSVASISREHWPELKEKLLAYISEYTKKISESGAEEIVCLNLDFFKVR